MNPVFNTLVLILYKVLLVMVFFSLAFSWVFEVQVNAMDAEVFDMNHAIRTSLHNLKKKLQKIELRITNADNLRTKVICIIDDIYALHDDMNNRKLVYPELSGYIKNRAQQLKAALWLGEDEFKATITLKEYNNITTNQLRDIGAVISELVQNAAKYSLPEKLIINLNVAGENDVSKDAEYLIIKVSNYGTGRIPPEPSWNTGLTTIKSIVSRYEGELSFHTNDSETIVYVKLKLLFINQKLHV